MLLKAPARPRHIVARTLSPFLNGLVALVLANSTLHLLGSLSRPALAYDPDADLVTGHFLVSDVADNAQWGATTPLALLPS